MSLNNLDRYITPRGCRSDSTPHKSRTRKECMKVEHARRTCVIESRAQRTKYLRNCVKKLVPEKLLSLPMHIFRTELEVCGTYFRAEYTKKMREE